MAAGGLRAPKPRRRRLLRPSARRPAREKGPETCARKACRGRSMHRSGTRSLTDGAALPPKSPFSRPCAGLIPCAAGLPAMYDFPRKPCGKRRAYARDCRNRVNFL